MAPSLCYVTLYEQTVASHFPEIIKDYEGQTKANLEIAAKIWRLPYWECATDNPALPVEFTTSTVQVYGTDGKLIDLNPNPSVITSSILVQILHSAASSKSFLRLCVARRQALRTRFHDPMSPTLCSEARTLSGIPGVFFRIPIATLHGIVFLMKRPRAQSLLAR
jgi:hypothetical protein